MSVLDDIRSLERRITSRLDELRPLVEEYRELESAARRLGIDPSATDRGRGRTRRSSGTSQPRSGRRRSTSKVSRRDQVIALVKEHPGITVPEMGTRLKVDPTGLYRVVRALEKEGAVKKDGKAVQPV
jgi:hypothetical protein